MPEIFDPIISRTRAFSEAMIKFDLETADDPTTAMGIIGISKIETVISASLVGLDEPFRPLLERASFWIERALRENEQFGPTQQGYHLRLNEAKGMAHWLLTGENDEEAWRGAAHCMEAVWWNKDRPWTMKMVLDGVLDDYLAWTFISANGDEIEDCEAGIAMYERWTGKSSPGKITGTLKPRDFAVALCRFHAGIQDYDEAALFAAGRRMLQANLQENWLGRGLYMTAALWLKLVYCRFQPELTPLQVILKAYDNMPKVQRPDFVPMN